jgi:hypothetical protein
MVIETPETDGWTTRAKIITAAIAVVLVGGIITVAVVAQQDTRESSASPTSSSSSRPTASPTPSGTAADDDPDAANDPSAAPADPSVPAAPVPLDQSAAISPGLTAAITTIESVAGVAQRPGEVAGPAIRVTVQITNTTAAPVSLVTAVVTAYYGADQTPALELGEPGASPMPAEVAPGQVATGVYVFTVPTAERGNVRVMVDYSVDVPPLVFEGAVPA